MWTIWRRYPAQSVKGDVMKIKCSKIMEDGSSMMGWTTPGIIDDWVPHDPDFDTPEKIAEREAIKRLAENNPDD